MTMANVKVTADNKKGKEACKLESRYTTQYSSHHGQQFYRLCLSVKITIYSDSYFDTEDC